MGMFFFFFGLLLKNVCVHISDVYCACAIITSYNWKIKIKKIKLITQLTCIRFTANFVYILFI